MVSSAHQMWLKFAWLGPEIYSHYLATLQWKEGEDKESALVNKLRIYKDAVTALLCTHVSSLEIKLAEHIWSLQEKIEEGHQKLRKEFTSSCQNQEESLPLGPGVPHPRRVDTFHEVTSVFSFSSVLVQGNCGRKPPNGVPLEK